MVVQDLHSASHHPPQAPLREGGGGAGWERGVGEAAPDLDADDSGKCYFHIKITFNILT